MSQVLCPTIHTDNQIITLAHGSGGKLTSELIEKLFLPAFGHFTAEMLHDGAVLDIASESIVFTTDSYVIDPVFFPGGDIGKLSVTGTLNDLAMCGAKPKYLSCSFIIEEGFLQCDLYKIVESMKIEAQANDVSIVTGDTKVIGRINGKNLFINTSGIGVSLVKNRIHPKSIRTGDSIILSGDIGRHGVAVMAAREGMKFTTPIESDCCSLVSLVEAMIHEEIEIHCLRDLTRGGLATALVELAESSKMEFHIEEKKIPICHAVDSACEILGFDPLYVANEGCLVAFVPQKDEDKVLKIMKGLPQGVESAVIGRVVEPIGIPSAILYSPFGTRRSLYRLMGDQLPRIC